MENQQPEPQQLNHPITMRKRGLSPWAETEEIVSYQIVCLYIQRKKRKCYEKHIFFDNERRITHLSLLKPANWLVNAETRDVNVSFLCHGCTFYSPLQENAMYFKTTLEVIVQIRVSVLPLISKYRQAGWKYEAKPSFFNQLVCI
jgi:hypothetical protein